MGASLTLILLPLCIADALPHGRASALSVLFDESVAERPGDGFGLGVDLELFVDVAHVELDGVVADAQLGGGRSVVVAFDEQAQQPRLVRRELAVGALGRAYVAEERDD